MKLTKFPWRGLAVGAMAIALLAAAATAWLPGWLKSQIETRSSALLGRSVQVEHLAFSLWTLTLDLRGLRVAGAAPEAPPALELAGLVLDLDARTWLRLAPVVERLAIDRPVLRAARLDGQRWDFDDIVARLRPAQPATADDAAPARFAVFNLTLSDGRIEFDDRAAGRQHRVEQIRLGLPFLSSLPADIQVTVQPQLAFVLDGGKVDLKARSLPYSADHSTELQLDVAEHDLDPWWAYLPAKLPAVPRGGTLSAQLILQFAQPAGQVPRISLQGRTRIGRLSVHDTGQRALAGWESLDVDFASIRPLEQRVEVRQIQLNGGEIQLRRAADGSLAWPIGPGQSPNQPEPAASSAHSGEVPSAAASAASSADNTKGSANKGSGWTLTSGAIQVSNTRIHWLDDSTHPATDLRLDPIELRLAGFGWPAGEPQALELSAGLSSARKALGSLRVQGQAGASRGSLDVQALDLSLEAIAPYLRASIRAAVEGRLAAQGRIEFDTAGPAPWRLAQANVRLDDLRVTPPREREPAWRVGRIEVEGVDIDPPAHRVSIGSVRVNQPQWALTRLADGQLDASTWLADSPSAGADAAAAGTSAAKSQPVATPSWAVSLARAELRGGAIDWRDHTPGAGETVRLRLQGIEARTGPVSWPLARADIPVQLSVQAAPAAGIEAPSSAAGRLKLDGRVDPLSPGWKGRIQLERWPVHLFEPYLREQSGVSLQRAELSVAGDADARWTPQGLALQASADIRVADVRLHARTQGRAAVDPLMDWQSLELVGTRAQWAPPGKPLIQIRELRWSDFHAGLEISEEGRFNLREVGRAPAGDARSDTGATPGASTAGSPPVATAPASAGGPGAAAAAPAAAAASAATKPAGWPVDLVIEGSRFANGRIDFSDRFVRPNYSAALTELQGSLGVLDSRRTEPATLELKGRAAGTALLDIRGSVHPLLAPLSLDLSARATDLELAPLTPYAGKYAGYAIERGKLSLDVAYRIGADGRLEARNQLILNQLTFGQKIDSPDATSLPVRLAVALLADRNGVIDIQLPITGSLEDPQFSVFGIVLKLIGNLLTKAVTAPFALLAGGGGEDLSVVPFQPGTAQLTNEGRQTLERVAKALVERPALRMTVLGSADLSQERDAMRRASLEARLLSEWRREQARTGTTASPAPQGAAASTALPSATSSTAPLSADARAATLKRLYVQTPLTGRPRNALGFLQDQPPAAMEAMLMAAIAIGDDQARELAIQRGLAVRDALIARGLPSERLFLGAPQLQATAGSAPAGPRVQLNLSLP